MATRSRSADGAYGFIASVLPVWFLLEPRDYLSTYMKLGTIALLIIGVFIVHPNIQFPMRDPVRPRRRTDHQRQALSLPVCHHCLRGDLRIPFAGFFGHDAEDAVEGNRRALHRLRRHDVRRPGCGAGADCRLLHVSGRLLRHQHRAGGFCQAGTCTPSTSTCFRRKSAKSLRAELAARYRWPSAWRRSSKDCRAWRR